MIMAKTLVVFLLAVILALSIISILLYVQTMNSHTIDRDDVFSAFREHALYKEFKMMYPDSVDNEYSRDIYTLQSKHTKGDDKLILDMVFDPETYSSFYSVGCSTDRHIRSGGAAYFDAFDYLHDNDCIVGDELSSDPGR